MHHRSFQCLVWLFKSSLASDRGITVSSQTTIDINPSWQKVLTTTLKVSSRTEDPSLQECWVGERIGDDVESERERKSLLKYNHYLSSQINTPMCVNVMTTKMEISCNWISWIYIVSQSASFFGHFAFTVNMWNLMQLDILNLHC